MNIKTNGFSDEIFISPNEIWFDRLAESGRITENIIKRKHDQVIKSRDCGIFLTLTKPSNELASLERNYVPHKKCKFS